MRAKLFAQALAKFAAGFVLVAALLFIPAGTLEYDRAWLLMGILFVPMFIAGLVMLFLKPELLQKRLDLKEKAGEQKQVVLLSGLMFVAAFVLAGLNERFGWCRMPNWICTIAVVLFLLSYGLYAEVLRENAWLSRTIRVENGQQVVDTGLYGIVRHPMYAATVILFLSMPLVLGSPLSFVLMLSYLPIINRRMKHEESLLEAELAGYDEYKKRVKYRIIPYVW